MKSVSGTVGQADRKPKNGGQPLSSSTVGGFICRRAIKPFGDCGLVPAYAASADPGVVGESAGFHFSVQGGARQAGAFENGFDPEDTVRGLVLHCYHLASFEGWWGAPG